MNDMWTALLEDDGSPRGPESGGDSSGISSPTPRRGRGNGIRARGAEVLASASGRLIVLVVMTVVSYHYSLSSLMQSLGVDSPLAYLGLVPFIALGLGIAFARPSASEPSIHDRYLDQILAVPLLVAAVAVSLVLPARLSSFYWLWRIDLLTLPLFVAAVVILLFGSRTFFRVKVPVFFLFLAWPVPFRSGLAAWLEPFTQATISGIDKMLSVVPIAHPGTSGVEGEYIVQGPAGKIPIVIATVCSGANSLLGWLLVASAVALVSGGQRKRKLQWIGLGAALVWTLNLLRIFLIFLAAKLWGQGIAFDVLHPYIGLVFFSIAVMVMVLYALPKMGIVLGRRNGQTTWPKGATPLTDATRRAVPKWKAAGIVVIASGLLLGVLDSSLRDVDPVASALGAPKLMDFKDSALDLPGFDGVQTNTYDWTRRFFGEDSNWIRYQFNGSGTPTLASSQPITADVVTTSDLQSFNDFGVEACYRFHGYDVTDTREVQLSRGLVGSILTWRDPRTPTTWTSLYWYWPIAVGNSTRYQRVLLLVAADKAATFTSPSLGDSGSNLGLSIDQTLKGKSLGGTSPQDERVRRFLIGFARQVIQTASTKGAPANAN